MPTTSRWSYAALAAAALLGACAPKAPPAPAALNLAVPAWSQDVVWYQIFVERFRNGDPTNDPTAHDIAGFTNDPIPRNWAPTPWGQDWYAREPWAKATGKDFYGTVQMRRYGGDLAGVIDRLDELQRLGVTALFLNPINDAPSLHKYDARSYHHIDRNFGPDPKGDEALAASENPGDPTTWRWSAADSLFLKLVAEAHRRGMRIIIDYSWNHTGTNFWAWQDVLKRQKASPYADWYAIDRFDDPATADTNEFHYTGWANVPSLPEWKKVDRPEGKTKGPIEGNLVPGVRDHIFAVTKRWLDPNGDGNTADGVDGFRLDVADVVPLGFWRDYRRYVRSINPEAYLVGEIWWDKWPDVMWDPAPWSQDSIFDAVMHYHWFTPTRSFFAATTPNLAATAYTAALDSLDRGIPAAHVRAMMNLTASHDTPRFGTAVFNPGQYKFKNTPREDSRYRIDKPDATARARQVMILVQQFTWRGAPHIWNGDEVGMWGADDPDERKPMIWGDLRYDDEVTHPFGRARDRNIVAPDTALRSIYQKLIALRKAHLRLFVDGETRWLMANDDARTLAYERTLGTQRAVVAFNASDTVQTLTLPLTADDELVYPKSGVRVEGRQVVLPPRGAAVWVRP